MTDLQEYLTLLDKSTILATDSRTLAKWWCKLNRFEWPEDLPDAEPAKPTNRRSAVMLFIREIVGSKAVCREWNRKMTDDEFDVFWKTQGAND